MNEKIEIKPQVISPLKKICMTIGELPTSYLETMTYYEMLVWFTNYLRDTVIPVVNNNSEAVTELQKLYQDLQDYVNNYFDNLDVQEEINNKLDAMADSGELAEIITAHLSIPEGNTFSLQRLGRKITFGTNPDSSTHSNTGVANSMQGGCKIDSNTVAYMLWDSLNTDLNKNTLVIMNINTGEIINSQNFTFGWCNSLAYNDGKIYVAVRGTTSSGVSTNNGDIKVINATSLELEDTISLSINVNAIAINDETLYVLEENSDTIYLYDLEGESLNQTIHISYDISGTYNQDLIVNDNYIMLLSTQPSNYLRVFSINGTPLKTYNVPKYGGWYLIGELQWLDFDSNGDMILGSSIQKFEETINQFFKFNLAKNIADIKHLTNVALSLNVDSSKDYYNPNGNSGNEFTTINEVGCLNIDNIACNGNSKNYKYTELSNNHVFRLNNATFTEGLNLQYGKYYLDSCTINPLITSINACLYTRYNTLYLLSCTINANSEKAYCIYSQNGTEFKISSPTFTGYTSSVFSSNIPTDVVNTNILNNIPYIPRAYNMEHNLMVSSLITAWKEGSYNYNTTLTATQISELLTNAQYIVVDYLGLNKSGMLQAKFTKSSNDEYTISDSNIAGSAVNVRVSKIIFTVTSTGVTVTSSKCSQIIDNGGTITTAQLSSEADSASVDNFIKIKGIRIICV